MIYISLFPKWINMQGLIKVQKLFINLFYVRHQSQCTLLMWHNGLIDLDKKTRNPQYLHHSGTSLLFSKHGCTTASCKFCSYCKFCFQKKYSVLGRVVGHGIARANQKPIASIPRGPTNPKNWISKVGNHSQFGLLVLLLWIPLDQGQ